MCAALGLMLVTAAVAAVEPSAPASSPVADLGEGAAMMMMMTPICPDQVRADAIEGWDPATCGTCGTYCTSDNACLGRKLGDTCVNSGTNTDGICQARTGCALYNCCYCS
jgi:hypothetical protein